MSPALEYYTSANFNSQDDRWQQFVACQARNLTAGKRDIYDNPRLDPKRFLDGPLSDNPATRLRQMLARPGIVVRTNSPIQSFVHLQGLVRLLRVFAMVSVLDAPLRPVSLAYTKGKFPILPYYGKVSE
jgi:hypothetical protein